MTILSSNNVRFTVSIPNKYNASQREEIAYRIIEQIKRRTRSGVSLTGRAFKYVKGSEHRGHNLEETGDMLTAIDIISTSTGSITIGYPDTTSLEANKAEAMMIGTYGSRTPDPNKTKKFLGIQDKELKLILAEFDSDFPQESGILEEQESAVNRILKGLLGFTTDEDT